MYTRSCRRSGLDHTTVLLMKVPPVRARQSRRCGNSLGSDSRPSHTRRAMTVCAACATVITMNYDIARVPRFQRICPLRDMIVDC
eukprot:4508988-Prymnesium_polylepis.1